MEYNTYQKRIISGLSFYCVLDNLDEFNNFHNAERSMKLEREKYISRSGGLEEWVKLRDRATE